MGLKYLGDGKSWIPNIPNRDVDDEESLALAKSLGYKRRDTFERYVAAYGLHERVTSSSEPDGEGDETEEDTPVTDEQEPDELVTDDSGAAARGD